MQRTQAPPAQPPVAEVLALGFGTTVAIWAVAYVLRLPAVNAPAALLTALIAALLLVGGYFAGKYTRRGWKGGLQIGLLSGVLNLLIVSSALSDSPDAMRDLPLFALASLGISGVLGLLGAAFGNTRRARAAETPNWTALFARVAVVATFLLVIAGGLVTTNRAGLAVPDWPNSFGYNMFLLPLSQMGDSHVFLEHAHRLLGALVGLTVLALALYISLKRVGGPRLAGLAWLAFALVAVQGLLGGLRVVETNVALGAVHGVLAQLIFGLLVVIAVLTSSQWQGDARPRVTPSALIDRSAPLWLLIVLVLQIAIGADMRHRQADSLLMIHITVAALVLGLTLFTGVRLWGLYPDVRALRRRGMGLIHITLFQIVLGVGAWAMGAPKIDDPSVGQAIVTTLHQANGALLLGWTVGLLLWSRRLLVADEDVERLVA